MKNVIFYALTLLFAGLSSEVCAQVEFNFQTNAVSVSQRAGAVLLPVNYTGSVPTGSQSYVYYSTQDGTAVSSYSGDYQGSFGSISYSNSTSSKNISIPIFYTGATTDRFFTVNLSNGNNSSLGSPATVVVTILAEQPTAPVTFTLSANSYVVHQAAGAVQIPVSYSGTPLSRTVWVDYSTQPGTAKLFDDYASVGTGLGRVEFQPGSNRGLITIPIANTGSTVNKFFTVVLGNVSEGQLGVPGAASITILGKGQVSSGAYVKIRTRSAHRGGFVIRGSVVGLKDSQIRKVTMTANGHRIALSGKHRWSARVYAASVGTYLLLVRAYPKAGGVITSRARLRVHR